MNRHMPMRLAIALATLALLPPCALAQTAPNCPALPADAGLKWEALDGPNFLFCRALRQDGGEAFAVTLSKASPFKPRRADRAETARIDGQETYWYRSEIAGQDNVIVRETLVDVEGGNVAHISVRATDQAGAEQAMQQAQSLSFRDARLSSN